MVVTVSEGYTMTSKDRRKEGARSERTDPSQLTRKRCASATLLQDSSFAIGYTLLSDMADQQHSKLDYLAASTVGVTRSALLPRLECNTAIYASSLPLSIHNHITYKYH